MRSLLLLIVLFSHGIAEDAAKLDPNHLYVVGFALGDGATDEALAKIGDYFTDTYPMGTIHLPDDYVNKEKKTITMIGPSLAQIVGYVEDACDHSKVVILGVKAGKLTKEAAEKVIKKMEADEK